MSNDNMGMASSIQKAEYPTPDIFEDGTTSKLSELEDALSRLDGVSAAMLMRLDAFLRADSSDGNKPSDDNVEPVRRHSKMAQRIDLSIRKVDTIRRRLAEATENIDI